MRAWKFYGNEWAVDLLKKHVINDNVRHAYLISGPKGVGRRTLATRLCQAMFCENGVDGEPCLSCRSCANLEEGKHFDLKVVSRIPSKSNILVEQVREAEAFLRLTPYSMKKKVVIFADFDIANEEAQNALLKTLEEAPSYAVMILMVENPMSLLPTVVSRCEIISLRPQQKSLILEFLGEKNAPGSNLELVANLAEGKPGLAYNLAFETGDELKNRIEWVNDLFTLIPATLPEQFLYIEKLVERDKRAREQAKLKAKKMMAKRPPKPSIQEDESEEESEVEEGLIEKMLHTWLGIFRDAYILSIQTSVPVKNIDFVEPIGSHFREWPAEKVLGGIKSLEKAINQAKANVNKRLLLEVFFLNL